MDFPEEPLDYLVVAAHPDDAEIGCGGAILSLKAGGARVGILDLTDGEPTPHGSPELRARETAAATAVLGVDWRGNLGLTNRCLTADLEARRKLAEAFRLLRPRVILAHYWEDAHPDHVAAAALTEAARFWAKLSKTDMAGKSHHPARLLYFFSVHLRLHLQPSFVLDVSPFQERKMQALRCYRSQFIEGRDPTPPTILDEVLQRGRYWGWTIGAAYGEPFLSRGDRFEKPAGLPVAARLGPRAIASAPSIFSILPNRSAADLCRELRAAAVSTTGQDDPPFPASPALPYFLEGDEKQVPSVLRSNEWRGKEPRANGEVAIGGRIEHFGVGEGKGTLHLRLRRRES